jgi:hypothetical protein
VGVVDSETSQIAWLPFPGSGGRLADRLLVKEVWAFVGGATNVAAVGWAHRASILTAEDFHLGSKEQERDFLSEQALNERKPRTPSKLMTRVRFPSPAPIFSMT